MVKGAGVSRRTFYQYFRDKDDVILSLYQLNTANLAKEIEAAVRGAGSPAARLRAPVDAYLDFQQRGGRLLGVLQSEAMDPESRLWPHREQVMASLVMLTRRAVASASGPTLDPLVYWTLFLGLENAVLHLRHGGPLAPDDRARMAQVFHPMFAAIMASAMAAPERFAVDKA
jgi:AcrR family transcriptional regulator